MEPHEALLWCVRVAAGEVRYATARINELEEPGLIVEHTVERDSWGGDNATSYIQKSSDAQLHIWVRARQEALDRLARFSKMALDAGIQDRQISLAEKLGERLAQAYDVLIDRLELTAEQKAKAPAAVRASLTLLDGGLAA